MFQTRSPGQRLQGDRGSSGSGVCSYLGRKTYAEPNQKGGHLSWLVTATAIWFGCSKEEARLTGGMKPGFALTLFSAATG
jgi:hypothetical protein